MCGKHSTEKTGENLSEEDVLNAFILRMSSLGGVWFPQVPVGLRRYGYPKYVVDLVRVDSAKFKVHRRISKRYWMKAMEGDSTYRDLDFNGKNVWLIEGKVVAGYGSVGQILVYKELFQEDWPRVKVALLGIVAYKFEEGVKEACSRNGIRVWELGRITS